MSALTLLCVLSGFCQESLSALITGEEQQLGFSFKASPIWCLFVDVFAILKKSHNSYSVSHIFHRVSPTEGTECGDHCNYFVQNLVKVLVC